MCICLNIGKYYTCVYIYIYVCVQNTPVVTTTTTTSTYPVLADRPEPSALLPAGGLFGPVKKFKKVTSKPVQQEPCLHNDLMDAIQTGGRDRLKKVRFIPSRVNSL